MRTQAQLNANRENAKLSTGPKTEAGKTASSYNHFRHGLTGEFRLLPTESDDEFAFLLLKFMREHQPTTTTEETLVVRMVQHLWLSQRAINLLAISINDKEIALYLRYQATQDRGFHRCLAELAKLRAEKRKAQIGFESQKRKQAEEVRREAVEKRRRELHPWHVLAAEAGAEHLHMRNSRYDTPDSNRGSRVHRVQSAETAAKTAQTAA